MARAIIAAAVSYGDDPVRACTSTATQHRRALGAAAGGLNLALGLPMHQVGRALTVRPSGVYSARSKNAGDFARAQQAAEEAVRWHLKRGAEAPPPRIAAALPATAPPVQVGPVYRGPPRPLAGPISAPINPFVAPRPAPPEAAGTLRARILGVLAEGSASTMGLATVLDVKELLVSQSLAAMQHEGLVAAGDMPPEGRRQQRWRVANQSELEGKA